MQTPPVSAPVASAATPWRRLAIGAVILALVIGASWYRKQHQALEVQVAHASRGALQDNILASGNLMYRTQVAMRSELMARVDAVLVSEGDVVKKHQLLLQLDKTSYQASLEQSSANAARSRAEVALAKTRVDNINRQLQRQRQLAKEKLVQQETVDLLQNEQQQARLQWQAAEQALRQAEAAQQQAADLLAKTELRAPIDGVVVTVDVKAGETVIPGSAQMMGSDLMTIADTSAVLAELRLDEADIHNVFKGQSVTVFAAAAPEQALHGKVDTIASSARQLGQSQALAFKVKVLLQPSDIALYPGMSCRAELQTQTVADALSLPFSALLNDKTALTNKAEPSNTATKADGAELADNRKQIWLIENGVTVARTVTTGLATDTAWQIVDGLQGNELVITGPARLLESLTAGQKVRFTAPPPPVSSPAEKTTAQGTADAH